MRGLLRRERDLSILAERPLWFIVCWLLILIFRGLCQSEKFASDMFGEYLKYFEAVAHMGSSLYLLLGFSSGFSLYRENKHEQYFITLPYSKTQIVSARYIVALIITLLFGGLFWVVGVISKDGNGVFMSLFYSIPMLLSLPLYYILGSKSSIHISTAVTVISVFALSLCNIIFEDRIENAYIFTKGLPVFCVILIVAYFLSWFISVYFYKKRDI